MTDMRWRMLRVGLIASALIGCQADPSTSSDSSSAGEDAAANEPPRRVFVLPVQGASETEIGVAVDPGNPAVQEDCTSLGHALEDAWRRQCEDHPVSVSGAADPTAANASAFDFTADFTADATAVDAHTASTRVRPTARDAANDVVPADAFAPTLGVWARDACEAVGARIEPEHSARVRECVADTLCDDANRPALLAQIAECVRPVLVLAPGDDR